jgi:chromate transporter
MHPTPQSNGTEQRPHPAAPVTPAGRVSLAELFWTFLKIGTVTFGGFMALIAVTADTVVEQRRFLKPDDMLDCISLANLLPGPQGVNCVAYVGYRLRAGLGALVSAVGVLLPTFVLMVTLTALYVTYAGHVPGLSALFAGFIPAVAAVVVSVVYRMGQNVLKGWREAVLSCAAALVLLAAPPAIRLYVTFGLVSGFGLLGYGMFRAPEATLLQCHANLPWRRILVTLGGLGALVLLFLAHPPLAPGSLAQIGLTFSGLSLLLFGGGYVCIPMIQDVVVTNYGWLTTQQFLDGLAFSQITPGPILVIATFIAQKVTMEQHGLLLGLLGAVVGTVGIFTPPAILMITASMALDAIRQSPWVQAAMRGIRCAVLGMISVAALVILQTSLPAWPGAMSISTAGSYLGLLWPTLLIFTAALVALVKYSIDVVWIIPVAGLLGFLLY